MANRNRPLRDTNFPFPMGFPTRMLLYVVIDLMIINLIALYLAEKLPLSLVLSVAIVEIVSITVAIAFWAAPYKLRW